MTVVTGTVVQDVVMMRFAPRLVLQDAESVVCVTGNSVVVTAGTVNVVSVNEVVDQVCDPV